MNIPAERERERERLQQNLGTVQMLEHEWQRLNAPATWRIQAVYSRDAREPSLRA